MTNVDVNQGDVVGINIIRASCGLARWQVLPSLMGVAS